MVMDGREDRLRMGARLVRSLRLLKRLFYERVYVNPKHKKDVVAAFHKMYYDFGFLGKTWCDSRWLGYPTLKCPLDLWIFQELLFKLKPDVVIECGTFRGGSALFLASVCEMMHRGRVISIDIQSRDGLPTHPRVTYVCGSSVSEEVLRQVRMGIAPGDKVLVILDSDHRKQHVLNELRAYSPLVSVGSYLIVEDTNVNGHPVESGHGPGPFEAAQEFLSEHSDFVIDRDIEAHLLSFNPQGYLRKIR